MLPKLKRLENVAWDGPLPNSVRFTTEAGPLEVTFYAPGLDPFFHVHPLLYNGRDYEPAAKWGPSGPLPVEVRRFDE